MVARAALAAMRRAGFRVLGFRHRELFHATSSANSHKAHIYDHIRPTLTSALDLGVTPFLDLHPELSQGQTLADVATTLREALHWLREGCEVGMYPYVIPFSGAAMAADPGLACLHRP